MNTRTRPISAAVAVGGASLITAAGLLGYAAGDQHGQAAVITHDNAVAAKEIALPAWLPANADRAAAEAALREGRPFQIPSHDDGFGCDEYVLLVPGRAGQPAGVWWVEAGRLDPGGAPLTWDAAGGDLPRIGCKRSSAAPR